MLYPCRECGVKISDQARRCPHCGCKKPKIKPASDLKSEWIGGLFAIGLIAAVIGMCSKGGDDDSVATTNLSRIDSALLYDEVDRYVIRPCLQAFLELDPDYQQAINKEERLVHFRNDPRIADVLDTTVRQSVSAVRDVAVLEDRKSLYVAMLAMCSDGAK